LEYGDPVVAALEQIVKGVPRKVKIIANRTKSKKGERVTYRITIPKEVVEILGLKDGDVMEVFVDPQWGILGYVKEDVAQRLRQLAKEGKLKELFLRDL